jgi:hypothetical protein
MHLGATNSCCTVGTTTVDSASARPLIRPALDRWFGLKGQWAHSPGQRPGYTECVTTALEGQKRYHVQKLLPFQGVVNRRHTIPRALPWANGSLPFQGVVNREHGLPQRRDLGGASVSTGDPFRVDFLTNLHPRVLRTTRLLSVDRVAVRSGSTTTARYFFCYCWK